MLGYYEYFPQKRMNVSVKETGESKYKILVAEKDFEAGDVIYKEDPLVVALDSDLQQMGTHCSHCLRLIHKGMAIKPESDRLNAIYCSKECQVASKAESQNLLFTLESPLPPGMDQGLSSLTKPKREEAQKVFTDYLKSTGKTNPLLLARLLARQISLETAKFTPNQPGGIVEPPLTDEGSPGYGISDHIERLRYIDVNALEAERKMITEVLGSALPGLESTLPEDKHALAMGKIAYNAFGVCYSGGRDDKPVSTARPEDQERTRTPYGTSRQIGSGLYVVSAYLAHSCEPNVRPSFSSGTAELHLVASRAIKKGDQLTMAFVDVTQHPDETAEQARRRRRFELARGWRFKCECSRCVSDVTDEAEGDLGVGRDESKVEAAVSRVESGQAGIMPDTD
ncbi:hypothetical protein PHLCEN_2v9375 [Hermanssonia centrifuga]|uniref:SET domain-containing protein n=1 Tax=Hermanssonia centrifuga TaxID=98765 RepID=A0A2R6NQY7_9APHY|nr:hypothetical protein PHLCEN_2v9375 [Hermanssonia centrifuga]